jgi:hypothetical protein
MHAVQDTTGKHHPATEPAAQTPMSHYSTLNRAVLLCSTSQSEHHNTTSLCWQKQSLHFNVKLSTASWTEMTTRLSPAVIQQLSATAPASAAGGKKNTYELHISIARSTRTELQVGSTMPSHLGL